MWFVTTYNTAISVLIIVNLNLKKKNPGSATAFVILFNIAAKHPLNYMVHSDFIRLWPWPDKLYGPMISLYKDASSLLNYKVHNDFMGLCMVDSQARKSPVQKMT